jgi:Tfp pilus assembly protein PilO
MKSSDRAIVVGLMLVGILAAFWFVVLSPKRGEVAKLDEEIATLEKSVAGAEHLASVAESSKQGYEDNYRRLVVLGKAVPASDDTASLFVQVDELAREAGLRFDAITLDETAGSAEPTAASQTTADPPAGSEGEGESGDEEASGESSETSTVSQAAPATEAGAAALPIGATVGPAGLPVMPYKLSVNGNFFQLADFFAGLDRLVGTTHGRQVVDGRLTTIDGFGLTGDTVKGFPTLTASVAITTYVTPADQGLTGGATVSAPVSGTPTPTSTATTP